MKKGNQFSFLRRTVCVWWRLRERRGEGDRHLTPEDMKMIAGDGSRALEGRNSSGKERRAAMEVSLGMQARRAP
jgi:hypothetical protein